MAQRVAREDASESAWEAVVRQAEVLGPLARGRKRRADVDRAALLLGSDHMADYRHLFAIENDAVHISVNVPVRFASRVRDAAIERRVTPNELVFTAVSHVLENLNAEAA